MCYYSCVNPGAKDTIFGVSNIVRYATMYVNMGFS